MLRLIGHDVDFVLLPGELILVGRGEICDIRLPDASVSRVHCRLVYQGECVTLTDANSRWGTFVNQKKVTTCALRAGDRLTVGETTLTLESKSSSQSTTISPKANPNSAEAAPRQTPAAPPAPFAATPLPELRKPSPPQTSSTPHAPQSERDRMLPPVLQAGDYLGQPFSRYLVESELGRSPSGITFQALDPAAKIPYAIKLFHPQVTVNPAVQQRIARSAMTMSKVRHPQLVTLYEAGEHAGLCYQVSELVVGKSVAAVLADAGIVGMLDPMIVLTILLDVANGLECAEEHGIIHRNITPSNILLTKDHRAKLNDLSLARTLDSSASDRITRPGEILGSLAYLSPESLAADGVIDHRSDIYQLGATGYALLAGLPPYSGNSPMEIITAIGTRELLPPSRFQLSIPPLLEGVIMRMLSRQPERRHPTIRDLRRDLERVQKYL